MNPTETEVMSTVSAGAVAVASVGAFASASIAASSTQSMWSLFNQYQLIMMFPFMRSYLTAQFQYFIQGFDFAMFDFEFLDFMNDPYVSENAMIIGYDQPDKLYAEHGLESGSYIVNQFQFFRVIIYLMMIHGGYMILYTTLKCKHKKGILKRLNRVLLNLFHYNIYIKILLEGFIFNFLAAATEVYRIEDAKKHTVSY